MKQDAKARALASIRESMAFFGHPLENVSDEELEAAVVEFGRVVALAGVTAQEATTALSGLPWLESYLYNQWERGGP